MPFKNLYQIALAMFIIVLLDASSLFLGLLGSAPNDVAAGEARVYLNIGIIFIVGIQIIYALFAFFIIAMMDLRPENGITYHLILSPLYLSIGLHILLVFVVIIVWFGSFLMDFGSSFLHK
jgi:hypothetical protein